ncbi:hypothetical protein DYB32_006725, partial [Aphanomyces invadans]
AMERTKLVDKVLQALHTKFDEMTVESATVADFAARMKESGVSMRFRGCVVIMRDVEELFKDRMAAIDEVDEELTELEDMIHQLELYAERICTLVQLHGCHDFLTDDVHTDEKFTVVA